MNHEIMKRPVGSRLMITKKSKPEVLDDKTAQFLKKKADDIKHKDLCADDLNIHQLPVYKKHRDGGEVLDKFV